MIDFSSYYLFCAGFLSCKCLFTNLQRKTSINIQNKMISYVATYEYEKGPRLDFLIL